MDPFTVPLTVGRMGCAASQVRSPALVFGTGVGGGRGWFRVSRWRLKVCSRVLRLYEALPLVRSTAPPELSKLWWRSGACQGQRARPREKSAAVESKEESLTRLTQTGESSSLDLKEVGQRCDSIHWRSIYSEWIRSLSHSLSGGWVARPAKCDRLLLCSARGWRGDGAGSESPAGGVRGHAPW